MRLTIFLKAIMAIPLFAMSQDRQEQPKSIGLTVSLPWVNSYSYYNYDLKRSSSKSGFAGIGASIFYTRGLNKLSLNVGFTNDLPVPIGPFVYAREGTRTNINSYFGEMLYHRNAFGKLGIIGGLNYVRYRFNFTSYVDSLPSYSSFDNTLGITLGSEYRFIEIFSLAVFYRPALVSFDLKQYRHLISLDARFDLIFKKRK